MLRCDFLCLSFTIIHMFLDYRNTVVHQLKARIMDDLPSWSVRPSVQLLSVGVSVVCFFIFWAFFFFSLWFSLRNEVVLFFMTGRTMTQSNGALEATVTTVG